MKYLLILLLLSLSIYAQSDSLIVLNRSDIPTALLNKLEKEQDFENNLAKLGKWAGMGKEVGVAISEGLGALNEESNKFADTKVGFFVMFIIALKIMGYVIIQIIVGIPLIIFGTTVFAVFFFKFCVPRKILKTETGTGKDRVREYDLYTPGENWYSAVAAACYVAFLLICTFIIFTH